MTDQNPRVDAELDWIKQTLQAMTEQNAARMAKQSEDHRRVMEKLEALSAKVIEQQGFISGALFTVRAFWLAVGAAVAGFVSLFANGGFTPR